MHIFRHLKLEFALAIPVSNGGKIGLNNPEAEGLSYKMFILSASYATYYLVKYY